MGNRSDRGDSGTAFGVALLVLAVVLCAPGLVATFLVASALSLRLDAVQTWAFGATASGVLWLGLSGVARSGWKGLKHHFAVSMLTAWIVGLSWWGLRLEWARELWRACVP